MQWAKLNVFQRLTRQWDALHPYNAAQVMKLAGPLDSAQTAGTWRETLDALGLGRVRFAGRAFRHEILNGALRDSRAAQLIVPPNGASLDAFITEQLNTPFDDVIPFRAFAIACDDGGAHYLGAVYHHWVADSASIRLLLREWFYRMHDPHRAARQPLRFPDGGYASHFGPRRVGWSYFDAGFTTLRWAMRLRRARRVEAEPRDEMFAAYFQLHQLPDGIVDQLLPIARGAGATLNDLFLAAAAQVCERLVPVKRTPRRPDLAMGSIVDLRARRDDDQMRDVFGLFLGFTSIVCHSDDARDWPRLLADIAKQNALLKRTAGPESSMVRMAAGLAIHRLYSRANVLNWYRKRLPLAGGVSNVNLNRDWPAEFHPSPMLQYARVSPLGPMMPLVFTTTTLGKKLNFGLTCRESIIPRELGVRIAEMFKLRLQQIAHKGT